MPSAQPAMKPVPEPHFHLIGEICPVCDQPIPNDKAESIRARVEAREQELADAARKAAAAQVASERARIEAGAAATIQKAHDANAEAIKKIMAEAAAKESAARAAGKSEAETALLQRLEAAEQARRVAAERAEQAAEQAAAREAAARAEGAEAATQAARIHIQAVETQRQQVEATLRGQLEREAQAKADAEESKARLAGELAKVKADGEAALAEAAQRENLIRAEAVQATEEAIQKKLAAAEEARLAAEQARSDVQGQLASMAEQVRGLKEAHVGEINQQREILEKDKIAAVNIERAQKLEMQMRLEGQLQDMQRQLQKKTADELGEGAELELFDVLKAAFEGDKIRRVPRGTPGADIIHEVVENGTVCGKIVYDSKNRNDWKTAYAAKLRDDQIAEKADYAVLSSNKFPANQKQLHTFDHVIIACPARVLALAELLRAAIVRIHESQVSNEKREEKSAALYAYITSEHCAQLFDSIETLIRKLEQLEVEEQKAHNSIWKKRGELFKAALKANGGLRWEIDRIVGIADTESRRHEPS